MGIWDIVTWIVFGFVVGWIADRLFPGRHPAGCWVTSALGICGALLFNYLSVQFLGGFLGGHHWIGAILGTLMLLTLYNVVFAKS